MKAVIYREPGRVEYGEIPEKELRAGEVKLAVDACGICGSDVQGYLGRTGRRIPPMVMGHEFCGTVLETGEGVPKEWKGKRVAVYPVDFCGYCDMCQKGDVHLCLNKRAFGVLDVDGAFAERINVPVKCCFPLADGVSDGAGALLEPLAVAYRGICHAGNLEGKTAVIIGAGTIGLLALTCCKLKKCGKVIVSDLSDSRLGVAERMGADVVLNPGKEDFRSRILEETDGRLADVAIEAVGVDATVAQAMAALRFGGSAVWIGNNKPVVDVNMQEIVTRELSVHGSFLYGYEEFKEMAGYLNAGEIQVEPLISCEIRMEEVPGYLEKLAHAPGDLLKVVVKGKEGRERCGI